MVTHVFWSHSAITNAVALGIIGDRKLSRHECIFLSVREFDAPKGYKSVPLETPQLRGNPATGRVLKKIIREFKRSLPLEKSYLIYLPHLWHSISKLLVRDRHCKGYYFIEEGLLSYSDDCKDTTLDHVNRQDSRPLVHLLASLLGTGGVVRQRASVFDESHANYRGAFVWNDHVFSGLKNRVSYSGPCFTVQGQVRRRVPILALDALVERMGFKQIYFETVYRRLLLYLCERGHQEIQIKFHPAQDAACASRKIFEKLNVEFPQLNFTELPPTVCLEAWAQKQRDLEFYVLVSSVGVYASLLGAKAFTIIDWLEEKPRLKLVERMPSAFFKFLTRL